MDILTGEATLLLCLHFQLDQLWKVRIYSSRPHVNPIALRKAKIVYNFGLSECNRVKELNHSMIFFVVVALLFYVHGKHLRLCREGQLT